MNIRDLKYLIALAEHCHFGEAAKVCFVSQPALSMQIQKLEEYLGIKLLERSRKSVFLTPHGKIVVERARGILNEVESIREFSRLSIDPYQGELRIGIIPTLAPYLLPHIFSKLSKKFPRVKLYLIEEQTESLIEKLKQGKLEAVFLATPLEEPNLAFVSLFDEEFLLALCPTHPLAKRKVIKQTDLKNQNILLLEEGHCLRMQILALCEDIGKNEMQGFRATSLETLRHMVMAGVGITLLPKLACNHDRNISYIPFSSPKPMRKIRLFWRVSTVKQILLQDIVVQIKKILSDELESVIKVL